MANLLVKCDDGGAVGRRGRPRSLTDQDVERVIVTESFKLSADPQFIDKVRDIAGLYLNPPDAAVVSSADRPGGA